MSAALPRTDRQRHRARRPLAGLLAALALGACAPAPVAPAVPAAPLFFDDFSQPDLDALRRDGWTVRTAPGHPGIAGARWGAAGIALMDDPGMPGNRLLHLQATTAGTADTTVQVQVCHARKYLEGTYAARVRLRDAPLQGASGDVVVQTFYAAAPLRFAFDPQYSEIDWEYLPNGGWGDARPRLYGVTWQTARIEPWLAVNAAHQEFGSHDGWHLLVVQVAQGRVRYFLDGDGVRAEHGGRNYPVVPMSINFSVWFSPGGWREEDRVARSYGEDIDWVLFVRDAVLAPSAVQALVASLRAQGRSHVDGVRAPDPALPAPCDN